VESIIPSMNLLIPSSGIGRSVAILYTREGADVTIVYLPEEQKDADETKSLVEKEGRQCLTISFDLKDLKNVDKIVQKHLEKFGALDIVVNNASRQLMSKKFEEIDLGMQAIFFYTDDRHCGRNIPNKHLTNVCSNQICPSPSQERISGHQYHLCHRIPWISCNG
jgi:hypothetical protein